MMLTLKRLKHLYVYDSLTGKFTVRASRYGRVTGHVLSTLNRGMSIDGIRYQRADLAWFYFYEEWPSSLVDHKDCNHQNDRINNLRLATRNQNQYNKSVPNPHGFKGVTWRSRKEKPWLSKIRVDGKRINLGSFATKEEAAEAYKEACLKYHGEFANLGVKTTQWGLR